MTKPTNLLLAAAALLGAFAAARVASAQADVNPQPPNVMLLVDTSGSMEYKSSSTAFPQCDPLSSVPGANEKSRWIDLLEVLTGQIGTYRCDKVDRNTDAFRAEYLLGSTAPADYQYPSPYHRPLSGTCGLGPGTMGVNVYDFPSTALSFHLYNNPATTCSTFSQQSDGILDSFANRVRFGLMTFDTHASEKTGVAGTSANHAEGVEGAWSYFLDNQPAQGMPAGCTDPVMQEVGARNAAAPPWEGRMIAFGNPNASSSVLTTKNQQIQQVLMATRPYGATPLAGMMDDALQFFWNDDTKDPLIPADDFGPREDPFVKDGCRKNIIVLLTDGEPNLDLRPYCEAPGGDCPYDRKPEETAFELATAAADKRIQTFVIGLASRTVTPSSGPPIDCSSTLLDFTGTSGLCATTTDPALKVCCTLHRIAFNGGTGRARFGDTQKTLRDELSAVLSDAMPVASRTLPVFASASSPTSGTGAAFRVFTSFNPQPFDLWKGVIERQRFVCEKDVNGVFEPVPKLIDPAEGDDFVNNVNSDPNSINTRHFISVNGEEVGGVIHSSRSIRPQITSDVDGLGEYGTEDPPIYQGNAAAFESATKHEAMAITGTTCDGLTDLDACKTRLMRWNVGLSNDDDEHRCRPNAPCNLIGDLYHSTPAMVSRPSAFLRDETYDRFASDNAARPMVLYTSTNDGFLHAFRVEVTEAVNNELWAFIPPAVLPSIATQYAKTHQNLLDGVPVVKDVVAKLNENGTFTFERGIADARGAAGTWRTVLIQSFGVGRPGYFALDITDPIPSTEEGKGPRFLWQLTTDDSGNPLFGRGGATPAITTVLLQDDSGTKEIPVAVLPGGTGPAPTAGALGTGCARTTATFPWIDSGYAPRARVMCYAGQGIEGRSLTIVRLDTGEILKTFRKDASEVPSGVAAASSGSLVELVPDLLSPITGTPVAFPGQTGAVADRVFVGDADGTLWRVDLSSPDPDNWGMRIFWDAYPAGTKNHDFNDGHPIMTPPVVSLDRFSNVTVAFSTGDQEVLTAPDGMTTYLWSVTAMPNDDNTDLIANLNWYLGGLGANDPRRFIDGERVAGPITLFNEGLYFTTYKPPAASSTDVCAIGTSRIWGVHYLDRNNASVPEEGGKPLLARPGVTPQELVQDLTLASIPGAPAEAVIFGASVIQLPTCFDDPSTAPGAEDPFTGGGSFRSITNITPGKFQLVMHTGEGGNAQTGGQAGVTTIELPSPTAVTRIDSWAAIVE